jgi:transcriptional regulator with XRE-family HTH domain
MGRDLDDVIKAMSLERQAKLSALAQKKANEMVAAAKSLADFRKAVGKTQDEVGKQLGIKQHAVSQLEKRSDLYLSTLARFLDSLGMTLELALIAADGSRIPLDNFHPWNEGLKEFQGAVTTVSKNAVSTNAASKQRTTAKESKPARAPGGVKRATPSSKSTKASVSKSVNAERRP